MKLGLLAKKKEEEEKRLCEKKRGPKASLNKHRRVKIYEFSIMPFNQFTGYYTRFVGSLTRIVGYLMKFLKYPYNKLRDITIISPFIKSAT